MGHTPRPLTGVTLSERGLTMQECEHLELYLDQDGRVEEAFCQLGHPSCSTCGDFTPFVSVVPTVVEGSVQYEPPF